MSKNDAVPTMLIWVCSYASFDFEHIRTAILGSLRYTVHPWT